MIQFNIQYKLWKLKSSSKISFYLKNNDKKYLHIGCGGNIKEKWLNTDIICEKKDAIYLDASKIFPLLSNSFGAVASEHVFEHLNYAGQSNYLKESFRVLMPGGVIRIATPDFSKICQLNTPIQQDQKSYIQWSFDAFLKPQTNGLIDSNFKEVYVVNNFFKDWGHQIIHHKESLAELISSIGFKNIQYLQVGVSNHRALVNFEQHQHVIGEKNNLFETMILEAIKK